MYLTDPAGFLEMEAAFAAALPCGPARIVVYCPVLPVGALVELDVVAVRP